MATTELILVYSQYSTYAVIAVGASLFVFYFLLARFIRATRLNTHPYYIHHHRLFPKVSRILVSIALLLKLLLHVSSQSTAMPFLYASPWVNPALLILILGCSTPAGLYLFMSRLPFTCEYSLKKQSRQLFYRSIQQLYHTQPGINLSDTSRQFEKLLINLSQLITENNKAHVLQILNISRSTFHRKIKP